MVDRFSDAALPRSIATRFRYWGGADAGGSDGAGHNSSSLARHDSHHLQGVVHPGVADRSRRSPLDSNRTSPQLVQAADSISPLAITPRP